MFHGNSRYPAKATPPRNKASLGDYLPLVSLNVGVFRCPSQSSMRRLIFLKGDMEGKPSWSTHEENGVFFLHGNEKRRLANLMKSMYAVLFDCIYSIPIRVGIMWLVFLW